MFKDIVKADVAKSATKGRSESLLSKRNNCMLARFYYYGQIRNKSFENILELMTAEFFLSTERISRIISQNATEIMKMKQRETTIYQLQTSWPQFRW